MVQLSATRGVRARRAEVTYPISFKSLDEIQNVITLGSEAIYIQSGSVTGPRTAEGWAAFPPEHPAFKDHWPKFPILPSRTFPEMVGHTAMLLLVHLGRERAQELTPIFRYVEAHYTADNVRPNQMVVASVRLVKSSWSGGMLTGTVRGTCTFSHPSRGPTEVAVVKIRFEALQKLRLNEPER